MLAANFGRILGTVLLTNVMMGAHGSEICFDFSKPVKEPLMKALALKKGAVHIDGGIRKSDGVHWGGARALVHQPIERLYEWLLDHSQWKDTSKTRISWEKSDRPGFDQFHTLTLDLHIFAFIRIGWVEHWGYVRTQGTPKRPREYVVSYQKVEGTSHLNRLCGSVVLKRRGPKVSDMFFYEEARADRYPYKDIMSMHQGFINRLEKLDSGPLADKAGKK